MNTFILDPPFGKVISENRFLYNAFIIALAMLPNTYSTSSLTTKKILSIILFSSCFQIRIQSCAVYTLQEIWKF